MLLCRMKKIAFLHTAQVHVDTFNQLTKGLNIEVQHMVKPQLLADAQKHGLDFVRAETLAALNTLSNADAVVCSCSTLGPIADDFSNNNPHVLRIDKPLMQAALQNAPNIAVVICLKSTQQSTLNLLNQCASQAGVKINPQVILCADAWQYFEAGDQTKFAQSIADQVKSEMSVNTNCIILAQASMRVAEPLLENLGMPILSSPKLAIAAAVAATKSSV